MNCGAYFFNHIWWNLRHIVRDPRMFRSLCENFIFRFSPDHMGAIFSPVPAPQLFFSVLLRTNVFSSPVSLFFELIIVDLHAV